MKKVLVIGLMFFLGIGSVSALDIDDTQIEDALADKEAKELEVDFRMKSFQSCDNMEDVMNDYFKGYWKNQGGSVNRGWFFPVPMMLEDSVLQESADFSESSTTAKSAVTWEVWGGGGTNFSKTNTQVQWVDESDIVKTDGIRSYYYNATQKAVFIIENNTIQKKIKIPQSMYSAQLYVANNKLVIITTGTSRTDYSKRGYFINRNSKTYTMVFDVSESSKPKLEKLYMSDGYYSQSRRIGDLVYVLSTNSMNFPYYSYKSEEDIDIVASKVIPRKIELTLTSNTEEQNLSIKGKSFPYNIKGWAVAKCNDIEYVFPDEDTMKNYSISPSYNIISVIDIENTDAEVSTKLIAWSNNEVYMSMDNLYLSSSMSMNYDFSCPTWGRCFMPFYNRGQNTLLHKLNIKGKTLAYQDSTIIPWSPLTQYSMDENAWNFRVITQEYYPERSTWLYILDEDLQMKGSLTWLGKTEDFKSSRFMGDKLYLVTFQQIDPFFVIDVSDATQPEVLGELKMPGYSTYLHPYDDTHIIGLGQATEELEQGRVRNGGLKVDLYEVNYDKKCGDTDLSPEENEKCDSWDYKWIIVKQKYTQNFWEQGSYSEALYNPRMFIWNKSQNRLLLPASLYKNDSVDIYSRTDFFQGVLSINIDKDSWITEGPRISHMDTSGAEAERKKECEKYTNIPKEPECKQLIWWWEYCGSSRRETYVPNYCFADSPIWEYIASRSWNYSKSFIQRALYIGDTVLTFSDEQFQTHDINSWDKKSSLYMK